FLQESLNVLNRNKTLYPDMIVDGLVGHRTMAALEILLDHQEANVLVKILNIKQGMRYLEILQRDSGQEKFVRGWLCRVEVPAGV
ncbi:MAG: hypothetical protein H7832_08000, partial [Magnetococcus sp. DMHC-6]